MSGFAYDTTTVWFTIELGAGDSIVVTGRDDGVNGFTWSAKQGDTPLTVTVDREVLIDGATPEDEWWIREDSDVEGVYHVESKLTSLGPFSHQEAREQLRDLLDDNDCDCSTSLVPGAIWPMASDGDSSKPWVESCGDCQVFKYDDDAAEAIAEKIGGRVEWATLPGRGGALRPYVLPTDYPLPAGHPLKGDTP